MRAEQGRAAPLPRPGYRPEIEGLRAVASLLVATYHIWLGRVSGGVDVFFVVSAFLITRSLLNQIERQGGIQLLTFWGGLARRLLPTAMLVLVAVVIAAFFLLPRPLWEDSIGQVVASALYVENWQLALNAVDYLAQGRSASPVQHYWALSTQGQFYLLWPFVILLALLLARRLALGLRTALMTVFCAVFVLSLILSIVATNRNQAFTYFNTFARLWEFSVGALLAVAPPIALHRRLRAAFGWLGLTGIISCGLIFQVSRVFPGYAALLPVGSAALIVLAGTSGSRIGVDRLLSLRPMVQLGGISYAIYLWHWPILTFYRWLKDHAAIGVVEGLGILAVSIALAALSTRFVEAPIRQAKPQAERGRGLAKFVLVQALPLAIAVTCWAVYFSVQYQHERQAAATADPDYPGALAMESDFRNAGHGNVAARPGMLAVRDDLPVIYSDGCYRPDPSWERDKCVYGDTAAKRVIAVVGGSHSAHWLPALDPIAREHGWRLVVYTKSNCLFSEKIEPIRLDPWCQKWNDELISILLHDKPDVVFTTSTRGSGRDELVPLGFLKRWKLLTDSGIQVVAVRDTPWMKFWVPECMEVWGRDSAHCAQPRAAMLAEDDPTARLASRPPGVHFLDMSEYFCNPRSCPPVIGNTVVYIDDSHVSATYARSLAPMLWKKLSVVLGGMAPRDYNQP